MMKSFVSHTFLWSLALALMSTLAGCDGAPLVNRVGVNVVDKDAFEGSWYMGRTVVDIAYEGGAVGTFVGDAASDFSGQSFFAMPRIRWVIEEDFLYAYRDYELTEGVDGEPRVPGEALGQPVAAYPIESHFDIRRAYNPRTGEEQNVLVENDQDRPWHDRDYMRVDWSKNQLPAYYGQTKDLLAILGAWERDPVDLFVQDETVFPPSWRPRFHRMGCNGTDDSVSDCTEADRLFAADYNEGDLYAFDFVEQETLSPGMVVDPLSGREVNFCLSSFADAPPCTSVNVYLRTSFLRVSGQRSYEPENWNDQRFDRHGFFRLERPTVDRRSDADDPAFGETDLLNYNVNRFNLWRASADAEGNPIPVPERVVRPIEWWTTPELPAHLVKPSLESVSAWNVSLMGTVRGLRQEAPASYPRVNCQSLDPDGYCFCKQSPSDGALLNPTCAGRYDPFQTPAAAEAAGAVQPYRCHIELPTGAEPNVADNAVAATLRDQDYLGWFGARFVGGECATVLRFNTCNRASLAAAGVEWNGPQSTAAAAEAGLVCEERGDLRFHFLSYIDQSGVPFLGVATPRSDPVTGEIIVASANVGGQALDRYRRNAMEQLSFVVGDLNEQELYSGEDVRGYLESLGQGSMPAPPRVNFLSSGSVLDVDGSVARRNMDRALGRSAQLRGPTGRSRTFSDRLSALAGTALEQRLTSAPDFYLRGGYGALPQGAENTPEAEAILATASPFRQSAQEKLNRDEATLDRLSAANIMMPGAFVDHSVSAFLEDHGRYPRARLEIELNRLLYFEIQLHELGHCFGLRHQFAGSADRANYHDDYYRIDAQFPLPDPADFDEDADPGLGVDEQVAYETALRDTKENRELAGIDRWMGSSVMDYSPVWYQSLAQRTGRYDQAALHFAYGDLVELYDNEAGLTQERVTPENTPRVLARYYQGGEPCDSDAACPYHPAGERAGLLLDANATAGVTQRCVPHPRDPGLGRVCSNFDDDAATLSGRFLPVRYQFCSDERAGGGGMALGTLGICNRFDEGDSYREIVRNVAESYERNYLWTHFRRYRSGFDVGGYLGGSLVANRLSILQNVAHNLMFRYANDTAFRDQEGPFGFEDQYFATADVLNFYGAILGTPDVGGYRYNAQLDRYERVTANPFDPGADLQLPIGQARYSDSVYQAGLSGIFRIERIGTFYDKLIVLDLMTRRGMQPAYTRDVPFYTNFYDVFPLEMGEIFGGMIRDRPAAFLPRVRCGAGSFPDCEEPQLVYPDFFRGDCSAGSTACRVRAEEVYEGEPIVDSGDSLFLRILAALYSLSEFPVFFDTQFARQLYICREGAGDCPTPRPSAVEGVDFARHVSERFGQVYVGFRVEGDDATDPTGTDSSIGFLMVQEASDLSFISAMLEKYGGGDGGPPLDEGNLTPAEQGRLMAINYTLPPDEGTLTLERDRVADRIVSLEGFFNQLIQLERDLGVNSYLGFTP